MKSLIIGMGIGQLYKTVLTNLHAEIVTVDSNIAKGADFLNIDSAITAHLAFDTVHICTPNFTHLDIAAKVAGCAKIVFIEKPGVIDSNTWRKLCDNFPSTRFMMVKNNMWRDNISELSALANQAKFIELNWINKDRVPHPGTWFTTKDLAFGGVSRDLMPHLLSLYIALNPRWQEGMVTNSSAVQTWQLEDLTSTDYGIVNVNGTYNVDDHCHIAFDNKWQLVATWRSMQQDNRNITFTMQDDSKVVFELGLCPEYAYQDMIDETWSYKDNDSFWRGQLLHDCWIHEQVEKF